MPVEEKREKEIDMEINFQIALRKQNQPVWFLDADFSFINTVN